MTVSLNIIRQELKDYRTEDHVPSSFNPGYGRCLPLPENVAEIREDCLYICGLSQALRLREESTKGVFVCLRDRLFDDGESGDAVKNLIIVNENIGLNSLVSRVQNRFFAVMDWEQRLHAALLKGATMQELVELCPPFLENHIQITDASFMKLAQSTAMDCDDPICVALKQYGYHPEETVAKFRASHLFDVWARRNEIYYDAETTVAKYPTVHKIFKFHGTYYAHVVMTCAIAPVNPAMMDLFRIFVNALSYCVERDWENRFNCIHPYDSVLRDLIEGGIKDLTQIEKRSSYAGLPMHGAFHILRIVRNENQNISFGAMMKEFAELFPRCKFINYQDSITVFVLNTANAESVFHSELELLEGYLRKHNSFCGVSSCFDSLADASHHFRQANLALKYGRELRQRALKPDVDMPDGNERTFFFDNCFPLCFFGCEEDLPELWRHSTFYSKLKQLYENDRQRGSNDLGLLLTYLRLERRISATASELNMHRNSLIYRINRIEEFLGVDLNDSRVRLIMLFSFLPAGFYGFGQENY